MCKCMHMHILLKVGVGMCMCALQVQTWAWAGCTSQPLQLTVCEAGCRARNKDAGPTAVRGTERPACDLCAGVGGSSDVEGGGSGLLRGGGQPAVVPPT